MGRKLRVSTIVPAQPGSPEAFQVFGPEDDVPEWAAKQIGDHAWADDDANDGEGDGSAPAKGAPKADWIAYAVSQGADEADAEAMTKEELVTTYGDK